MAATRGSVVIRVLPSLEGCQKKRRGTYVVYNMGCSHCEAILLRNKIISNSEKVLSKKLNKYYFGLCCRKKV